MRSSLLHPDSQSSPELPKLKCAFHPDQTLTNFCSSKECLLPLCPSCIKIHVNEHISMQTNPELENINDSIRGLYQQFDLYSQKLNLVYRHLVQVEAGVEEFREQLKGKIHSVKHDMIAAIQDHFRTTQLTMMQKVNELKYAKHAVRFKEYAKKAILSLKNSERNFLAEQSKIIKMVIKFESFGLRKELEDFCKDSQDFISLQNSDYLKFEVKENAAQLPTNNFHLFKLELQEPTCLHEPKDISIVIKTLYEKPAQKRETRKSLYKYISQKNTPVRQPEEYNSKQYESIQPISIKQFAESITSNKNMSISEARPSLGQLDGNHGYESLAHRNMNKDRIAYSSVKDSIVRATKDFNQNIGRNSHMEASVEPFRNKRRSVSKGRGLTLINNTIGDGRTSHCSNFLGKEINMSKINSKAETIPAKFR